MGKRPARHRLPIALALSACLAAVAATSPLISAATTYTVQRGDTLFLIARKYNVTVDSLREANNIWTNTLLVGQKLIIPDSRESLSGNTYTVKSGDTLYLIARRFNTTVDAIRRANNIWSDVLYVGQTLTIPGSAASTPSSSQTYVVQSGDTLFLIAAKFGVSVQALREANNKWDDMLLVGQRLIIPAGSTSPQTPASGTRMQVSDEEFDLLARLIQAEAEAEPYAGKVAVGATVLNRVKSPLYPDTITEVIYQVVNGIYYQYTPVLDGRINLPAGPEAIAAARDALNGMDPSLGATGFYNPDKVGPSSWVRTRPVTVVIGNHVFFK